MSTRAVVATAPSSSYIGPPVCASVALEIQGNRGPPSLTSQRPPPSRAIREVKRREPVRQRRGRLEARNSCSAAWRNW